MKYKVTFLFTILLLFALCCSCNQTSNKDTETLKKENEQLKKENETLKNQKSNTQSDQTTQEKTTTRYPTKKNQSDENTFKSKNKSDDSGCTYWITRSSHKRHNSSCRYYKNSNGYCTDNPNEGVACKICGG
jgi:hypothetical protein